MATLGFFLRAMPIVDDPHSICQHHKKIGVLIGDLTAEMDFLLILRSIDGHFCRIGRPI